MFGDIYYVVRFDNGRYYDGRGFSVTDKKESENIEDATLYILDWQIPKDLYLQQYLFGKVIGYRAVKVKITKSYEVFED